MSNLELRGNAMLAEITAQRNMALDRCAVIAADLAQAEAKIKELEALVTPEKPAEPPAAPA